MKTTKLTLLCVLINIGAYGQLEMDTVKTMLMYSDTQRPFYIKKDFSVSGSKKDTTFLQPDLYAKWIYGLQILELIGESNCHWVHKKYLNKDGSELSETITVWQTKRIE